MQRSSNHQSWEWVAGPDLCYCDDVPLKSAILGVPTVKGQTLFFGMAADLVADGQRGKAVGIAFSGVLCGILLARVVSGAVGQWLGWREAFWLADALAVLLGALLAWRLPDLPRKSSLPYGRLLVSMKHEARCYAESRSSQKAFAAQWKLIETLSPQACW